MVVADTHIIIWNALAPEKLSKTARRAFDQANESDGIVFCDISLWEIAMLMEKKRLVIDIPFLEFIELVKLTVNYQFKSISPEIASLSSSLSSKVNGDPADRLIMATAINLEIPLITADKNLRDFPDVNTIFS
jgi:PIN domain nuclease of toxin-antitoxin system